MKAFFNVFNTLLYILVDILKFAFFLIVPFIVAFFIQFKKLKKEGFNFQKQPKKHKYKISKFKRIFILFPRQFLIDKFTADPYAFNQHGLHLVCGEQGSGKTCTVMYLLRLWKKKYPKLNIRSNIHIDFQDEKLRSINDVIDCNNGVYGQVDFFDEIQQEFNCNASKNFPPEMIGEISQQRKQHKVIMGTSQVFQRVAKPIREQVSFLYEPMTIFNCITVVRVLKPLCDEDGKIKSKRPSKVFFFVHDKEIRECYDTYEKVKRLSKNGFKPYNEQYNSHYKYGS